MIIFIIYLVFLFSFPNSIKFLFVLQSFVLSQDVLMSTKEEEWGSLRDSVVLRDRLMTDAALGGPRPIKSEHSYSLLAHSPPPSPATPGVNPHTPNSGSGAVGSSTSSTSSSIDFANLDQKSLDIRRIDGKMIPCNLNFFLSLNDIIILEVQNIHSVFFLESFALLFSQKCFLEIMRKNTQ